MFIDNGELRFAETIAQDAFDGRDASLRLPRAATNNAGRTRLGDLATHDHQGSCDFVNEVHNVVQARLWANGVPVHHFVHKSDKLVGRKDVAMRKHELVRKPSECASEPEPGPATKYFSEKFNELLRCTNARDIETGHIRKARCTSLAATLKHLCDGKMPSGLSQANLYRFTEAKATPNIETVYELAKVLNVSPREFLPDRIID